MVEPAAADVVAPPQGHRVDRLVAAGRPDLDLHLGDRALPVAEHEAVQRGRLDDDVDSGVVRPRLRVADHPVAQVLERREHRVLLDPVAETEHQVGARRQEVDAVRAVLRDQAGHRHPAAGVDVLQVVGLAAVRPLVRVGVRDRFHTGEPLPVDRAPLAADEDVGDLAVRLDPAPEPPLVLGRIEARRDLDAELVERTGVAVRQVAHDPDGGLRRGDRLADRRVGACVRVGELDPIDRHRVLARASLQLVVVLRLAHPLDELVALQGRERPVLRLVRLQPGDRDLGADARVVLHRHEGGRIVRALGQLLVLGDLGLALQQVSVPRQVPVDLAGLHALVGATDVRLVPDLLVLLEETLQEARRRVLPVDRSVLRLLHQPFEAGGGELLLRVAERLLEVLPEVHLALAAGARQLDLGQVAGTAAPLELPDPGRDDRRDRAGEGVVRRALQDRVGGGRRPLRADLVAVDPVLRVGRLEVGLDVVVGQLGGDLLARLAQEHSPDRRRPAEDCLDPGGLLRQPHPLAGHRQDALGEERGAHGDEAGHHLAGDQVGLVLGVELVLEDVLVDRRLRVGREQHGDAADRHRADRPERQAAGQDGRGDREEDARDERCPHGRGLERRLVGVARPVVLAPPVGERVLLLAVDLVVGRGVREGPVQEEGGDVERLLLGQRGRADVALEAAVAQVLLHRQRHVRRLVAQAGLEQPLVVLVHLERSGDRAGTDLRDARQQRLDQVVVALVLAHRELVRARVVAAGNRELAAVAHVRAQELLEVSRLADLELDEAAARQLHIGDGPLLLAVERPERRARRRRLLLRLVGRAVDRAVHVLATGLHRGGGGRLGRLPGRWLRRRLVARLERGRRGLERGPVLVVPRLHGVRGRAPRRRREVGAPRLDHVVIGGRRHH